MKIANLALIAAALAYATVRASAPAGAQAWNPWTLGIVNPSFVWNPSAADENAIHDCAYRLAKQTGWSAAHSKPHEESPLQGCLLRIMHERRATANAIAFTHWYFGFSPNGESGFIAHLDKPRYGPVQLATMMFPGRANNNRSYLFVNSTKPPVIDPVVAFEPDHPYWKTNPAFAAIEAAHPNAWVYPQENFVGLARNAAGGQRFTIAAPIVDGCHACARVGVVYIDYDFGPLGGPKDVTLLAVHPCPSSDARCKELK